MNAGIAQLVEHNLAKVGVASSNLVSRSKFCGSNGITSVREAGVFYFASKHLATWQSGYAADCKSVDLGSTPGVASIQLNQLDRAFI